MTVGLLQRHRRGHKPSLRPGAGVLVGWQGTEAGLANVSVAIEIRKAGLRACPGVLVRTHVRDRWDAGPRIIGIPVRRRLPVGVLREPDHYCSRKWHAYFYRGITSRCASRRSPDAGVARDGWESWHPRLRLNSLSFPILDTFPAQLQYCPALLRGHRSVLAGHWSWGAFTSGGQNQRHSQL